MITFLFWIIPKITPSGSNELSALYKATLISLTQCRFKLLIINCKLLLINGQSSSSQQTGYMFILPLISGSESSVTI